VLRLLIAATLTGCATAAGAAPFLFFREVGRRVYDGLLGLGAGLMLSAATLGLLPQALAGVRGARGLDGGRLTLALTGLLAGVGILSLMDRVIPHLHAGGGGLVAAGEADPHAGCQHASSDERARHQGLLVLGAMFLHRLPEGFAIGAGFAVDALRPLGLVLATAVALQNAVEGAVMAAPLRRGGLSGHALLALVWSTGLSVPLGAIAGYRLSGLSGVLPFSLALGAGALLYLACNEVIPESHSHGHERSATVGLLTGFVLFIVLQAVTGGRD
jgi:ZIP family zinc transporter